MSTNAVLDLLTSRNISYRESAKDYVIKCLNPEHDDKNPSLRVDKVTGKMHCFSCGYKVNLFTHFGILSKPKSIKVALFKKKLTNLLTKTMGQSFPSEVIPFNRPFRGISAKTLKHFSAFYTVGGDPSHEDRIFFPITDVSGKTIAYLGRRMLSDAPPRYLVYPSGVPLPVYPEVMPPGTTSVVLVEGMFDMLNLYDKGLSNVCCAFGTNTLDKTTQEKLLAFKVQGVAKVYLLFDADKPGKDAAKKLKPIIENVGFSVEILDLEEGKDPGDLSQEEVDSIKEYILND